MSSRFFCGHCGAVLEDPENHSCRFNRAQDLDTQRTMRLDAATVGRSEAGSFAQTVLEKLEAIEEKVTILLERRNT